MYCISVTHLNSLKLTVLNIVSLRVWAQLLCLLDCQEYIRATLKSWLNKKDPFFFQWDTITKRSSSFSLSISERIYIVFVKVVVASTFFSVPISFQFCTHLLHISQFHLYPKMCDLCRARKHPTNAKNYEEQQPLTGIYLCLCVRVCKWTHKKMA